MVVLTILWILLWSINIVCSAEGSSYSVKFDNGELLSSQGKSTLVGLYMQGIVFIIDFFTLTLGGCDVVLRVQWLLSLGPIF